MKTFKETEIGSLTNDWQELILPIRKSIDEKEQTFYNNDQYALYYRELFKERGFPHCVDIVSNVLYPSVMNEFMEHEAHGLWGCVASGFYPSRRAGSNATCFFFEDERDKETFMEFFCQGHNFIWSVLGD